MDVHREADHPALRGELGHRVREVRHRVVHENVDRPVGGARLLDEAQALLLLADVGDHHHRLAAGGADAIEGRRQRAGCAAIALVDGARDAGDVRALGGEELGDRLADAAARSGHDHGLALGSAHRCPPPPRALRASRCPTGAPSATRAGGAGRVGPAPSPSSAGGCAPHAPIPEEHAHGRVVDARDTSQGRSGPPTHPRMFSLWGLRPHTPARIARPAAARPSGTLSPRERVGVRAFRRPPGEKAPRAHRHDREQLAG